jgi:hypothetical protein
LLIRQSIPCKIFFNRHYRAIIAQKAWHVPACCAFWCVFGPCSARILSKHAKYCRYAQARGGKLAGVHELGRVAGSFLATPLYKKGSFILCATNP